MRQKEKILMNENYLGIDYIGLAISSDEPAMFEVNAPMNKKFYYDFGVFHHTKNKNGMFIANVIIGILLILTGITARSFFSVIFGVVCIAFTYIVINKSASDSMKNAYHMGHSDIFRFYGDYFVNRDYFSLSVIPYGILTEAHETQEYFFLYISSGRAFVIPKGCFVSGFPEGMRNLLSEKLGNRFKVHR